MFVFVPRSFADYSSGGLQKSRKMLPIVSLFLLLRLASVHGLKSILVDLIGRCTINAAAIEIHFVDEYKIYQFSEIHFPHHDQALKLPTSFLACFVRSMVFRFDDPLASPFKRTVGFRGPFRTRKALQSRV